MTHRQVYPPIRLKTHGLACGRGETVLAGDIDLDLAGGTGLVLRGANGVGKSTLLLTLAGLLAPLAGHIELIGHDAEDGPALHHCGHRNAVRPRLSVKDTLTFWAAINGAHGLAIDAALDRVGLGMAAKLDAGYLSAGQGRRLALARLLVSPRPLWLLDEPGAALDTQGQALLADLLASHLQQGGLAILASHDPVEVAGFSVLTLGERP
ncbi:MAG: heme ABC exporter ATP-binding protein CcmA [Devosia sp.]|uniref:heme ABC exporter ATP-binding protein CcmA n=1 Tax=Devosia sp. TaxID=1871048 RepID=UPI0024C8CF05|nr:heme ABC exporter ATP-binding protein CcmA [Devosia sp.]UYN98737.1 MAG: heme ABC exporter ATP-binding protein CcmA [Devosia sp.]